MQRRHDLGTFSDRAADALHGSRADVAHGEDTGDARLERRRTRAGDDEAVAIQRHARALEPCRLGLGTREDEHVTDPGGVLDAVPIAPVHVLEATLARPLERDDHRAERDLDVPRGRDPVDQVARHARGERWTANHHRDLRGAVGEEDRGLTGGVTPTDDHDVLCAAELGLEGRCPVPDAAAFERPEVLDRGTPIPGSGGDDDRARTETLVLAVQNDEARLGGLEGSHVSRNHHLGAELSCLGVSAAHESRPRDPRRKAEVILDARALAGLPADPRRVQEDHGEPLRRGVDRGRQPGRARADDRDVVARAAPGRADEAELSRERVLARVSQVIPVREDHQGKLAGLGRVAGDDLRGDLVARVEHLGRLPRVREESLKPQDVR